MRRARAVLRSMFAFTSTKFSRFTTSVCKIKSVKFAISNIINDFFVRLTKKSQLVWRKESHLTHWVCRKELVGVHVWLTVEHTGVCAEWGRASANCSVRTGLIGCPVFFELNGTLVV